MPLPNDLPTAHLTIKEAADRLSVSIDTIRRWAKKGLLKSTRSEQNYRLFRADELDRLQSKHSGQAAPFKILERPGGATPFMAVELFSGCGGLALGFERAGIQTRMLVELDKNACKTLRRNWPNKPIIQGDVGTVDFTSFRDKIDVVAGGFPCQAFSYAGYSRGFEDTRGTLFFQFARCLKEVRPKVAVGENVRGLLKHDGGRTLETMLRALREIGYRPEIRLLRGQFLDVPQKRERLVILAVRDDLDLPHLFPAENDYTVSLREALKDVPESPGHLYSAKKRAVMDLVPEGGYWRSLPDPIQRDYMGGSYFLGGGKTGMARRLAWDEPSLTLTCSPMQKQTERCHPTETRPLTTREYARIQSFPDEWQFEGSVGSVYKQIGNAVPVNLAYHVARCVVAMLDPAEPRHRMGEGGDRIAPPPQLEMAL
ncbi:DNA (cytosine-5-)-methyltransferase [soil metagenome]